MHDSLFIAVRRLLRGSFISSAVIVSLSWVVGGIRKTFLTAEERSWVVLFSAFPVLAFVLGLYFYESRALLRPRTWKHVAIAVATCAFLLAPPTLLVFRYDALDEQAFLWSRIVGLAVLGYFLISLPFATVADESRLILPFAAYMKRVMWDAWVLPRSALRPVYSMDRATDAALRTLRGALYANKPALVEFQATLTCPAVDARAAAALLKTLTGRQGLNVLDIGGGDGAFTRSLLDQLGVKGATASLAELLMVDPVDWSKEYLHALGDVTAPDRVKIVVGAFEAQTLRRQYDLVVASHALYSMVDLATVDGSAAARVALDAVRASIAPHGEAVVVLASGSGSSYRFKARALEFIFGARPPDATAELMAPAARSIPGCEQREAFNVMDLTGPLDAYGRQNSLPITLWLSYFLRMDVRAIGAAALQELVQLLDAHLIRFGELPEDDIRHLAQVLYGAERPILTRTSKVLLHKTVIFRLPA